MSPLKTNEFIMNKYHFTKSILTGTLLVMSKKWNSSKIQGLSVT